MVRIRLARVGSKKRPYYRVVAIDQRRPRDGRPLEFLGTYDPKCLIRSSRVFGDIRAAEALHLEGRQDGT